MECALHGDSIEQEIIMNCLRIYSIGTTRDMSLNSIQIIIKHYICKHWKLEKGCRCLKGKETIIIGPLQQTRERLAKQDSALTLGRPARQ